MESTFKIGTVFSTGTGNRYLVTDLWLENMNEGWRPVYSMARVTEQRLADGTLFLHREESYARELASTLHSWILSEAATIEGSVDDLYPTKGDEKELYFEVQFPNDAEKARSFWFDAVDLDGVNLEGREFDDELVKAYVMPANRSAFLELAKKLGGKVWHYGPAR